MTAISEDVDRLRTVLEAEEATYRRLRALLRREGQELVELDPNRLETTTGEKRALAAEARLQEQTRVEVVRAIAARVGLSGTPRLSELIAALAEDAGPLPELHARLSALIQATRDLLEANERFANRSLARVKDTLRLLGQAVPESPAYGPGAPRSASTGRGRLVRAAI